MASRCCPPRSVTAISVEQVAALLRNGSVCEAEKFRPAAELMERLGVIRTESFDQVLCANPRDKDYAYVRDRSCGGRITLDDRLDEDGNDFVCPECSRIVHPHRYGKARYRMLHVSVEKGGVERFLEVLLGKSGWDHKRLEPGVWRVDATHGEAKLVAVGCCRPELVGREWAVANRACYVFIDVVSQRWEFRKAEWMVCMPLAELVCQPKRLTKLLADSGKTVADLGVMSAEAHRSARHATSGGLAPAGVSARSGIPVDLPLKDDGYHWIVSGRDAGRLPKGVLTAWSQVLFEHVGTGRFIEHEFFRIRMGAKDDAEYWRSHKQNRTKLKKYVNFQYDKREGMRLPSDYVKSK